MARLPSIHGTTRLAVRPGGHAAVGGEGQVNLATNQDLSRYIP